MFRYTDWGDVLVHTFLGMMGLGIVLLIGAMAYDGLYMTVRSEPKVIACAQKQMEAHRYSFTDSVVCTPSMARRDTIYVDGGSNAGR